MRSPDTIQGPAQSPDGTRLAFSALTHLYVMDLPGGSPTALVGDDVRGFQPAWSPDGLWIAYVTWSTEGGHLWKVRSDGSNSPVRLTSTAAFYADPAWSPDGTRIVALRGSAFQRLTRAFDFGHVIVYATTLQTDGQYVASNLFKFIVGMYFHDSETSGMINFRNFFEFVSNGSFGSAQRKRHSSIVDFSGYGVENGDAVDVMEINTQCDIFQILVECLRDLNNVGVANARRLLISCSTFEGRKWWTIKVV